MRQSSRQKQPSPNALTAPKRYCGRDFTEQELEQIRQLIAQQPHRNRTELSRLVCRLLGWYKVDGGLKAMSCRVAMLRMQDDGLIRLPPSSRRKQPEHHIRFTQLTAPQPLLQRPLRTLEPLQLQPVRSRADARLWNEYIHRYHYLGHKTLPGAQMRYFVTSNEQPVALLGFGASAWQVAPRDQFIGWSHEQRKKNLHLVINNARFLILPWIQSNNLASKILSLATRQLPTDWETRYGYRPLLLETFVESDRFAGTCYKAANWSHVGKTKGRGKLGPAGKQSVPIKDIWLYPLNQRFRVHLTR